MDEACKNSARGVQDAQWNQAGGDRKGEMLKG